MKRSNWKEMWRNNMGRYTPTTICRNDGIVDWHWNRQTSESLYDARYRITRLLSFVLVRPVSKSRKKVKF